jgi:hypothetical protein
MDARVRRALWIAPLAAVAGVAAIALVLVLILSGLMGEPWFAIYGVSITAVFSLVFGVSMAYAITGALVLLALATRSSLADVSYRTVAVSAVVATLIATLGMIWYVDNLEEWWMSLFAALGALAGARTFVRLRK